MGTETLVYGRKGPPLLHRRTKCNPVLEGSMGATERDLETALYAALAKPEFQQWILRITDLPGSQYSNTNMRSQWPKKPDPTILDLRLDFKHDTNGNKVVLGIELKTPREFADSKQLDGHLQALKLKEKNWQKLAAKKNTITKLLVISKGNVIDPNVEEIKQKKSWNDVVYWLSWGSIRDFVDKYPEENNFQALKMRLTESGVVNSSQTFSAKVSKASTMISSWEKNYPSLSEEIEQVNIALNALDYQLQKYQCEVMKQRSGDSYSFAAKVKNASLKKWIYREYRHPLNNDFTIFFGLDLQRGKWYGSLVPEKFNKSQIKTVNKEIKNRSNKSSRKLSKNVWFYETKSLLFPVKGWEFSTNRNALTVSKFIYETLNPED